MSCLILSSGHLISLIPLEQQQVVRLSAPSCSQCSSNKIRILSLMWSNYFGEWLGITKILLHDISKISFRPSDRDNKISRGRNQGEEGKGKREIQEQGKDLNPSHSYNFDVNGSKRLSEPGEGSQVSRKAGEQHKGILATPVSKSAPLGIQLKSPYANSHRMGNKQEEVETCTRLQG